MLVCETKNYNNINVREIKIYVYSDIACSQSAKLKCPNV
jgi:hypothetical protein